MLQPDNLAIKQILFTPAWSLSCKGIRFKAGMLVLHHSQLALGNNILWCHIAASVCFVHVGIHFYS